MSVTKRWHSHEAQQVAKVRRQEEEEAASRACEEICDNAAVNLSNTVNLVIYTIPHPFMHVYLTVFQDSKISIAPCVSFVRVTKSSSTFAKEISR